MELATVKIRNFLRERELKEPVMQALPTDSGQKVLETFRETSLKTLEYPNKGTRTLMISQVSGGCKTV